MPYFVKKIVYRAYHCAAKVVQLILPFPEPELLTGPGSVQQLHNLITSRDVTNVLVVTDKIIMELGLMNDFLASLNTHHIHYSIFDDVQPNPTIQNVEDGLAMYQAKGCEGIVAFGGGSPIDCAKIIAARSVVFFNRPVRSLKSLFRVTLYKLWRRIPPLFVIPTTAGTGSETTIAAVISDPMEHEKFVVMDTCLVPVGAALDPEIMLGLPPHMTSTTGMDALTHAVEAYIGWHGTKFTNEKAEKATRMIFENLEAVYRDGADLERRNNMALASYYAGAAFTRASVGYVHAIAHNLGGLYGVHHGLANAIILPHVLASYGKYAEKKLARLAVAGGIGSENEPPGELADRFIEKIRVMNKNMGIPATVKELRENDIPLLAERVLKEARFNYPVPKVMTPKECETLIRRLLP